jgi:hypothetical protein
MPPSTTVGGVRLRGLALAAVLAGLAHSATRSWPGSRGNETCLHTVGTSRGKLGELACIGGLMSSIISATPSGKGECVI